MAYKALYRKYRPTNFNEVKGQVHVVKTLMNSLKEEKFSHAYIFNGPRGTGKTTIAKIVAKALNCEHYPSSNPCNACPSCLSINDGSNPNVIELDAASNNGVDEIRDLIENIKYVPSGNRFKVYIIDEFHMLSTGAFNALLKTLEEPPAHAVFILCTTEIHKIPATIISRCQRFDFKGISIKDIEENILEIAESEGIKVEKEAANLIATLAEGGMRDALSLFDQALAYSNGEVTVSDVNDVSGAVDAKTYIKLLSALRENDISTCLDISSTLVNEGKEVKKIVNGFIAFIKDVLLYKNKIKDDNKYLYKMDEFKTLANTIDSTICFYYIDVFSKTLNDIKFSLSSKTYLDLALIKSCDVKAQSESGLMNRMDLIEDEVRKLHSVKIASSTDEVVVDTRATTPTPVTKEKERKEEAVKLDFGIIDNYNEIYEVKKKKKEKEAFVDPMPVVKEEHKPTRQESLDQAFEDLFGHKDEPRVEDSINSGLFETKEEKKEEASTPVVEVKEYTGPNPYEYDATKDLEMLKQLEEEDTLKVEEEVVEAKKEEALEEEIKEDKETEEAFIDITNEVFEVAKIATVMNYGINNRDEARQEKAYVVSKWNLLSLNAETNIYSLSCALETCKVEAVGKNIIILTNPNVDVVNNLMRQDNKEKLRNLIRNVYNNDYEFLLIPDLVYKEKRQEFLDQYRSGQFNPVLTPIKFPGLKVERVNNNIKSDIVKEAYMFVGEENVKIK